MVRGWTTYCRDHQLTLEQRLLLFRKICQAVAYAHQHLVIHRDIKPANIRVTTEGEPKLLDFGIAKLLDPAAIAGAESTMTLAAVMTPEYASPEQARGENITTASDIYSLGVVLYELLTGEKPYNISQRTPAHVAQTLTEREPTRPSIVAAKSVETRSAVRCSPKSLRGDLDNIILKALRKEPQRRYVSAGQFSEDILRHLEGRPVIARKDTVGYRTSKFVARNKAAVLAAVVILFVIIASSVVSFRQAQNARRQRDLAQREKARAEHANRFLLEMLGAAAPDARGVEVKVVDVLEEASRRAKAEIASQPEVMAEVLMTLGRTYISLSLSEPAVANLRVALETSLQANGELHPTTAATMGWLGLALAYQDKAAEGQPIARRAVELQRKLHPDGNAELGIALYSWGLNLVSKNEAKSAVGPLQEATELIERHLGTKHGYYLATLTALALAKETSGEADAAESLYHRAIAAGADVEQRYRIFLAQANGYLGALLTTKREYAEAEVAFRQSETLYRELMGNSNANLPAVQANLGRLYFLQGNYAAAETEYRKALETILQFYPAEHYLSVNANGGLGVVLTRLGRPAEGEPFLRKALELRRRILPPANYMIPYTESALGECLLAQRRYADAEPPLLSGYQGLQASLGDKDPRVDEARRRLALLYDTWGKSDLAARYR